MNQIKRPLIASASTPNKKFRSKFSIDITQSVARFDLENTCLEDLSSELLFEVFDYLDGCDIYVAFGGLNNRFNNLLFDSSLMLKINLSSTPQSRIERSCRDLIIPNRNRLLSLCLSESLFIDEFFNYCSIDSSFTCLQSMTLHNVSEPSIFVILSSLYSLPCLYSLTLAVEENYYYNLTPIYRLIFRLPYLKSCKVSTSDYEEHDVHVPLSINEKHSTIERLIIKHPCTIDEITSLLLHTPALQYLVCDQLTHPDDHPMNTKNDQSTLVKIEVFIDRNLQCGFR